MTGDEVTPVVLTFNEGPNIARCLERLSWAKRVIVVDSNSSDNTCEAARRFTNTDIVFRTFDSHTSQWNFGLSAADTEWILALDADYILPQEFPSELSGISPIGPQAAYFAAFRYLVFGKPLRSSLYPPRAVLFRRSRCCYVQDGHTQSLAIEGETGHLRSVIDHDDRKPLSRWLASQDKYAALEVDKLLSVPTRELRPQDRLRLTGWAAVPASLVYTLLARGTLLDGWRGWYYAMQRMLAEMLLAMRLIERRQQ